MLLASHTLLLLTSLDAGAADPARASVTRADAFHERFPAEAIKRFDITLQAGDVTIQAAEDLGLVTVDAVPVDWPEGCTFDASQDAERAWLHTENGGSAMVTCRVNVLVTLGVDTTVTVSLGHGDVKVSNLLGALTADIGAGDLTLEGMGGALDAEMGQGELSGGFSGPRLRAEVGSGGVHLDALVAPADLELGMGNVELIYAYAPTGLISARTGTGSVKVLLPNGTPVRAELAVGIGAKRIDLPTSDDAPTYVDVTTGVGRIVLAPAPAP